MSTNQQIDIWRVPSCPRGLTKNGCMRVLKHWHNRDDAVVCRDRCSEFLATKGN
jgi:hypothetical protein